MRKWWSRQSYTVHALVGTLIALLVLTASPLLVAQVIRLDANEVRANSGSDLTLKAASGQDVRIGNAATGDYEAGRAFIIQRGMRLQFTGGAGGCAGSLGPLPAGGAYFSVRTECVRANSMIFVSLQDTGATVVATMIRAVTSGASFAFATASNLSEAVSNGWYFIPAYAGAQRAVD